MFEFTTVRKEELQKLLKDCKAGVEVYNNSEYNRCTYYEPGYLVACKIDDLPDEFTGDYEVMDSENYKSYFKNGQGDFEGKRLVVLYHELYTKSEEMYQSGYKCVKKYRLPEDGYDNVAILNISKDDECSPANARGLLSKDIDDLPDWFFGGYVIMTADQMNGMFTFEKYFEGSWLVVLYCKDFKFDRGKYIFESTMNKLEEQNERDSVADKKIMIKAMREAGSFDGMTDEEVMEQYSLEEIQDGYRQLPQFWEDMEREYNGDMGKYIEDRERQAEEITESKRGGKREGAGRPKKHRRSLNLQIDEKAGDLLEEESERTGKSRSDIVNSLIKKYL